MKFTFHCPICAVELGEEVGYEGVAIDVQDDGIYRFKCPRGHDRLMEVQQERFQILFQIGAEAIGDGYYRESVSSFTAALERFYEFCIRVYVIKIVRLSGAELTFESFDKAWKQVSNMSERQYGAYVFLHASLVGSPPELQSSKEREFRNGVIHKGLYSSKVAALEYGEGVLRLLRSGIDILHERFSEELDAASAWSRMAIRANASPDAQFGLLFQATIVSLLKGSDEPRSKKSLSELLGFD